MAEEMSYHDGDIVWVKMNKLWWPGEIHGTHRLPSDFMEQFKKPPLHVIKFFQEQNYHCVTQLNQIARFNCAKKNEFIKKGLDLYYAKHSYMAEFPADVVIAEKRTGGNASILYNKEFKPVEKADKTTPVQVAKGSTSRSRRSQPIQTSTPSIPRVMIKPDHDTRILVPSSPSVPATSLSAPTTPTAADNKYKCNSCNFSTNRINTLIWHQKTHSSPKTPQMSTTPKYPIKHTPSTSTITSDETKLPSTAMRSLETEATPENCTASSAPVEIAEPMDDTVSEPVKTPEPVILVAKPKAKRGRSVKEPKPTDKTPKTDNKLKKILDDWSDDEIGEAGPSGLISSDEIVERTVEDGDDEDDIKPENKRSKLDIDLSNTTEVNTLVPDDLNPKIVSPIASADDDKIGSKSKVGNAKDETVARSSIRRQMNDVADDDVKPQTRSLRSGKTTLVNESPPLLPKRRGRAKRSTNESPKSEHASLEIKESEAEPVMPEKTETDNVQTPSSDKNSDESVPSAPVQASAPNKSHSKTSRKGKPRRKEEIKLSNNISVAVLVEKTNLSPLTDYAIEQKLDIRAEDNEFVNVVHKKIRYMSRNSTDGSQRKSIESIEAPKLPAPTDEKNEIEENDRMTMEFDNHQEADTTENTAQTSDQTEEKIAEATSDDVSAVSGKTDVDETSVSILEKAEEEAEKITENLTVTQSSDEQRVAQRCYERKVSPRKSLPLDRPDSSTASTLSIADDVDAYDLPSSSNLRQRSPRRYENTRNRRKSERRSNDDFTSITKTIDEKCEESDRRKSLELNRSLDMEDSGKLSEAINGKEDVNDVNSKTSTPEKADSSKELDCFDFTEDECLNPPEVLNRRKRIPPAKIFELDNIDKIDEESARVAQQREEENEKLHAELENLLNSTTPATLPEIPENFPDRRAEKDPEKIEVKDGDDKDRMLPPKERNKRIFKYRNRNRRPDFDMKVGYDVEETKTSDPNGGSLQQSDDVSENNVVPSVDNMEQESNIPEANTKNDSASAHDLTIEIAETLINFPLLSPHTDVSQESIKKVSATKRKESGKTTKNAKKSRTTEPVKRILKIEPDVRQEETAETINWLGSATNQHLVIGSNELSTETISLPTDPDATVTYQVTNSTGKKVTDTHELAVDSTVNTAPSSSVRDFSRIRLIEKVENPSPVHSNDETPPTECSQLPLKKIVILTQTEGNSFITRIPKKRKSQMDDDVPAFVIERPKDHCDDALEPNSEHKKEPKSFIVTKTAKKQITGELETQNIVNTAVGARLHSNDVSEGVPPQQDTKSTAITSIETSVQPVANTLIRTVIEVASEKNETPAVVTSQFVIQPTTTHTQQKKTVPTSTVTSSLLGSLSANRPCTIAPAKGPCYRKPADMTGVTEKQIGVDVQGNPIVAYSKIESIATQASPAMAQTTLTVQRNNEPVPGTSQVSNQGNQFVITSKGTLITNKPFITTTHSTPLHQRSNIIHTQIIRSPNPPTTFHTQQEQKPHPSPQSSQTIIQNKPSHSLSHVSSVAPAGKKLPTNRRSVGNKAKATDKSTTKPLNDTTATSKQIVRRISKNQPSTAAATQQVQSTQQQQQVNSDINYIGNAPVPPLIPINDQSTTPRQQSTKKRSTQMAVVPEPQSKVVISEVVEQQQDNILALPGDTPGFGGPTGSYFLCKLNEMGMYVPIDRQPLYLDVTDNTNLLKPNAPDGTVAQIQTITLDETDIQQSPALNEVIATNSVLADQDVNSPKYLINISDGQQLLVDQQGLMALTNGEEFPQFVTPDGQQIILQSGQNDILSAIAFAEDVGLIAGQQILIPEDDLAVIQGQGGNHDILAAALAGTEGFNQEQFMSTNGVGDIVVDPMVYHAMTQPAVPPLTNAVTNETNAILTQPPIMSTLEQPTKTDRLSPNHSMDLDESLAVIGVTSHNTNVPTSLELPITITNPAIAPKSSTSSMSAIYPPIVAAEHDLDYDIFSSSSPITHHLTQPLADQFTKRN